jgi:DNA-binding response OmpR family regulator
MRLLHICLEDAYAISTAANGDDGIRLAIERVPALVLSDLMMPGTDGLGVCRALKAHVATSHIPIVLLSAKADPASRIEGLQSGADVYMVKPFDKDELRAQLHNLMARAQRFHQRYEGDQPDQGPSAPREDEFVARVREVIMEHLGDDQFSVGQLERAMFLSRSQLHKKLVALTGMPASRLIQRMRLQVARERLQDPTRTISDVAYEVGFTDPNYFTRCYVREYGETPRETRNQ